MVTTKKRNSKTKTRSRIHKRITKRKSSAYNQSGGGEYVNIYYDKGILGGGKIYATKENPNRIILPIKLCNTIPKIEIKKNGIFKIEFNATAFKLTNTQQQSQHTSYSHSSSYARSSPYIIYYERKGLVFHTTNKINDNGKFENVILPFVKEGQHKIVYYLNINISQKDVKATHDRYDLRETLRFLIEPK